MVIVHIYVNLHIYIYNILLDYRLTNKKCRWWGQKLLWVCRSLILEFYGDGYTT